ncbi:MAG: class I SAM-dependent methyltransferase, partial [Candidatus Micrarchaeia archaeon]
HRIISKGRFIYLPVTGIDAEAESFAQSIRAVRTQAAFAATRARGMAKANRLLKNRAGASKAYDVLGNIAIINKMNANDAKKFAKEIMRANKRVKTVVMKSGAVSGKYRTRGYAHILGERNYVAAYRENGCVFVFDIRKAFFSARLAYERKRIAEQVKEGEHVMVMFAGVGPFAIEIAKARKRASVVAIELNSYAYESMLENIRLNKTANVVAVKGDVRKKSGQYRNWADRIVMPLPKSAASFFESVAAVAKKKCVVHYYAFGDRQNAFESERKKIEDFFEKRGFKVGFVFERRVREYSPGEIEIVLDFTLRNVQNAYKTK